MKSGGDGRGGARVPPHLIRCAGMGEQVPEGRTGVQPEADGDEVGHRPGHNAVRARFGKRRKGHMGVQRGTRRRL